MLSNNRAKVATQVLLNENKIFMVYVKYLTNNLYAATESAITEVKKITLNQIVGVAKTRGIAGQIIKVITPIYNENESEGN